MPYVVAQPCVDVKDKACVDECPVDCIYEGSRSLYINPNECVDCGACEPVCRPKPSSTRMTCRTSGLGTRTPPVSFFAEVGDLGGASARWPDRQGPGAGRRASSAEPVSMSWRASAFHIARKAEYSRSILTGFAADVCTRQRQTGFCMERLHVPARRLPYAGTWL